MSEDPWKEIAIPDPGSEYISRRVDARLKWNFFWARSADAKCALILNHAESSSVGINPPRLKGIEVSIIPDPQSAGGSSYLVFKLHESEHRDIFYRLCSDIVDSAILAETEAEAVAVTVSRAWRWHHLLKGGRDGRLSLEEQKGLIGELLVFEAILLEKMSPANAVNCWTGPLGAPKDFEIGDVCIESKARRGAATPFVAISSEFQLDEEQIDSLFLHVADLNRAPPESSDSFSLTDVARRIEDRLDDEDPGALSTFEGLLLSAGFDPAHDYSDFSFLEGNHATYLVEGDFPRITPSRFQPGLSRVRYSVSLPGCASYKVDLQAITDKIGSVIDGE